jgi:hypothetical protein
MQLTVARVALNFILLDLVPTICEPSPVMFSQQHLLFLVAVTQLSLMFELNDICQYDGVARLYG